MSYYTTKREAERDGRRILAMMKVKKRWQIEVFNNLGWCCHLTDGKSLHLSWYEHGGKTHFSVLLGNGQSGLCVWNDSHRYTDPNEAVEGAVRVGKEKVAYLQGILDEATKTIGGEE